MSATENIFSLFNHLRKNDSAIWAENDTIRLNISEQLQNEEIFEFIKKHKGELISSLTENHIFSEEKFLETEIIKGVVAASYPLSFAQERLWFIEQYEQGTNAYHMPSVFELEHDADIAGIRYALEQIVSRHEVLRSTIEQATGGYAVQKVHNSPLIIEELLFTDEDERAGVIKEDINRPFDLSASYPIRAGFYSVVPREKGTAKRTLLLINVHHIASDGWSTDIFQRELLAYYNACISKDDDFRLPGLEIQYKDYAAWQKNYLTGSILNDQLTYWKEKLSGYQHLALPTDHPRPLKIDYNGAGQTFTLNEDITGKLRSMARQWGVTMHSLLLSSINILLNKYSGQEDIVVGSPTANRHFKQTEGLIGFFVNTQVNRTILKNAQSFEDLVKQVHEDQVQMQSYQDLPFEKLVIELGVERDMTMHPVFQVSFVVQSFGKQDTGSAQQKNFLVPFASEDLYETTKFDMSFYIDDSGDRMQGFINYATSLFTKETIERLTGHYIHLLTQLAASPKSNYSELSLLGHEEYNQIINLWNDTGKVYPEGKTIHQLFREQADCNPENIALVHEGKQMTYRELNEKSDLLSWAISAKFIENTGRPLSADTLIALCLDRSPEMVIGMLAILKTGGAYVPIDPRYPQERINYILEDTKAALVLSKRNVLQSGKLHLPNEMLVSIDLDEDVYVTENSCDIDHSHHTSSLAYVIYTSGSSGKPKGVMIAHDSVINYVNNFKDVLDPSISNIDLSTSLAFDLTVTTTLGAIISGKTIFIYSGELSDINSYAQHLVSNKIEFIKGTPAFLASMPLNYFDDFKIKQAFIGGEKIDDAQLEHILKYIDTPIDEYGPTEATVGTSWIIKNKISLNNSIGKPYFNYKIYILDRYGVPVPVGVTGELYIGGSGLARGYLNQPTLTLERFIPNPFADEAKGYTRLYKTGDLVKWLPDGNFCFTGRNDEQVKIRGYRIELGEIEHALSEIAGIKQSCVVVKERKTGAITDKYIVGYYVLDRDHIPVNSDEILDNWQQLYEEEYSKEIDMADVASDFTGWNSYVTSKAIPVVEMEEWRDGIISTIRGLDPGKVLEIGVGSGLLMYPLLEHVKRYVGLDISRAVINRHKKQLESINSNTSFHHLNANQVDLVPGEELFDTIIINSVCQYFPGINYFNEVIQKSINKLSENGRLFIGDVRNYALHKELIREKFTFEERNFTQHDIDIVAVKENELLISPDYFTDLGSRNSHLKIEILPRTGDLKNELSKYRYDVVISLKDQNNMSYLNSKSNGSSPLVVITSNHYNIPFLNQLSKDQILAHLKAVLPDYMMPASLITMESFPLTVNGKLDKRALPDPDLSLSVTSYVAARTATEKSLVRIWSEVLNIEEHKISVAAKFFDLGGHSLNAIRLLGVIQRELGVKLALSELFSNSSITGVAEKIDLSDVDNNETDYILFNRSDSKRSIFYIPPILGLPVGLDMLLNNISDYNTYGLKYTGEEDFVDFCVKTIKRLAAAATYVSLIGYSAGGNIAFEIARELERAGQTVDLVVLIDSAYREAGMNAEVSDMEGLIRKWLVEEKDLAHFIKGYEESIFDITYAYSKYFNNTYNKGEINARLVNYIAESNGNELHHSKWEAGTKTEYSIVQGVGKHHDLLYPVHAPTNNSRLMQLYISELERLN